MYSRHVPSGCRGHGAENKVGKTGEEVDAGGVTSRAFAFCCMVMSIRFSNTREQRRSTKDLHSIFKRQMSNLMAAP